MFAVIYSFKVKKGRDKDFIKGWESLTKLIYQYEGSLGSRVHSLGEGKYLAYAQWPSKEIWANAGSKIPESADEFRLLMKDSCERIETEYEMDVVVDLIKTEPHH